MPAVARIVRERRPFEDVRTGGGFDRMAIPASPVLSMPKVEIYTWRFCPFCIRAKQLLDRKGVAYEEYVIDGDEDARDAMVARGSDGRRSVPQVFIDDAHVGGCDDLYALERQGRLDALLAVAS